VCFTTNRQSFDGFVNTLDRIIENRKKFPFDRAKLLVLPTLTRFDVTKAEKCDEALKVFSERLEPLYYDVWMHHKIKAIDLLKKTVIPYSPEWSFWEDLPVVREGTQLPQSIGYAFEANAALIANKLAGSELLVKYREAFVERAKKHCSPSQEELKIFEKPQIKLEKKLSTDMDRHYRQVVQAITKGLVVPFLGADVNLCDRPNKRKLEHWQPDHFYPLTEDEIAAYVSKSFYLDEYLPKVTLPSSITHDENILELLGEEIIGCNSSGIWQAFRKMTLPEYIGLAAILEGSSSVQEELNKVLLSPKGQRLNWEQPANRLHRLLARLSLTEYSKGYDFPPQLIVTTCLDSSLEKAFEDVDSPYDLVYFVRFENRFELEHKPYDGEPRIIRGPQYIDLPLGDRPIILKLLGNVNRVQADQEDSVKNLILTEDDYIEVLYQSCVYLPYSLQAVLRRNSLLFLGYGLTTWNKRVILRGLFGGEFGYGMRRPWWAVKENPGISE
jgi:hypothetical protein